MFIHVVIQEMSIMYLYMSRIVVDSRDSAENRTKTLPALCHSCSGLRKNV